MMKGEMGRALIDFAIGHWIEVVTEGDPLAHIEERGVALTMDVFLVPLGKREAALIMVVIAVQVPIEGRGVVLCMSMHTLVVLIERGLAMIIAVAPAIVPTKQKG